MLEFVIFFIFIIFLFLFIKNFLSLKIKINNKNYYTQTTIHKILKNNIGLNKTKNKVSQAKKRHDENKINIIILDDKAYWISNNVFYIADVINGQPVIESGRPINTETMSKEELDKMLFIVDNLSRGDRNDSTS